MHQSAANRRREEEARTASEAGRSPLLKETTMGTQSVQIDQVHKSSRGVGSGDVHMAFVSKTVIEKNTWKTTHSKHRLAAQISNSFRRKIWRIM